MSEYFRKNFQVQTLVLLVISPLFIWAMESLPQRTLLKEVLSLMTIVAFTQVLGLFYLSRINVYAIQKTKLSKLLKMHKIIGYVAVTVLVLHPFLIVLPRFFEAGITAVEALTTIITTFTSKGIVLGIVAWCLMLTIGVTALLRKKLPLTYRSWRVLHAVLACLCVFSAAYHVIDLGRHADVLMTAFILLLSAGGIYLLVKGYVSERFTSGGRL